MSRRVSAVAAIISAAILVSLLATSLLFAGCATSPPPATLAAQPATTLSTQSTAAPPATQGQASTSTSAAPATSATTPTTLAASTTTTEAPETPALPFDSTRAMKHVKKLASDIGVRPGGSAAEDEAVVYARDYLRRLGYETVTTDVPLPNGRTSHNVTAVKPGRSPLTVIVGGHLDTKRTTPGANDDASGAAAVLEFARDLSKADVTPTIVFVLFGTEEIIDGDKSHHHYGSRSFAANMTSLEKQNLAAMISLDMIAYGDTFNVRTMGKGPRTLRDMLQEYAKKTGVTLKYLRDTGPTGWSDHEPFERAGYPAVWLQWLDDPTYHQAGDTYGHISERVLGKTGRFVLGFLTGLTEESLEELHGSVQD